MSTSEVISNEFDSSNGARPSEPSLSSEGSPDPQPNDVPIAKPYTPRKFEETEEFSKAKRTQWTTRIVSVVLSFIGVIGAFAFYVWLQELWTSVLLGVFFVYFAGLAWLLSNSYVKGARKKFNENEELIARASAFSRVVESAHNKLSLEHILDLNGVLMTSYHAITKQQAEQSFRSSQRAMLAGLSILLVGVVCSFLPTSVSTKVAVASLAAVGTLISGYISKTFLRAHTNAITQLNRFFQQPVVNSYLLNAERIAANLACGRDELLTNIAQESVGAARLLLQDGSGDTRREVNAYGSSARRRAAQASDTAHRA